VISIGHGVAFTIQITLINPNLSQGHRRTPILLLLAYKLGSLSLNDVYKYIANNVTYHDNDVN
jgi:hypothetical protein